MMNNTMLGGWGFGFGILWALHILAVIAFFTGVIFLIMLATKTLTHAQLKSWGWSLVLGGTLVCLLTIGMMGHAWNNYGMRGFGLNGGMMRGNFEQSDNEQTSSQAAEEAEGKALYDKLQTKQTTCADLKDGDFELIGEYVMGQQLGGAHGQMNDRIKQMMGDASEEQMHILLGKNATGCLSGTQSSLTNGMMNGGMMQRVNK